MQQLHKGVVQFGDLRLCSTCTIGCTTIDEVRLGKAGISVSEGNRTVELQFARTLCHSCLQLPAYARPAAWLARPVQTRTPNAIHERTFAPMKTALLATALALSTTLVGCAANTTGEEDSILQTHAAQTSTSCFEDSGILPMKAALAVSMGIEMGRINTLRDLEVDTSTWRVRISTWGYARCRGEGRDGCPNTQAILDLQKSEVNNYIPQTTMNATHFRQDLIASFDRQRSHENNLRLNYPSRVPQAHELTQIGTYSKSGACGVHYEFFAEGTRIENIKETLVFFGGTLNPFIDFESTSQTIAIDPTGTMNGDTTTTTLSCTSACTSTNLGLRGGCCACNGMTGKFQSAPWNSRTLYCAY